MAEFKDPAVCFKEEESAVRAIEKKDFAHKTMPDHEAMQEGRRVEALYYKYNDHIRKNSDIDTVLLDSLPNRVGAYAYCVANVEAMLELGESTRERFLVLKKKGYEIRRESLRRIEYIFRKDDHILEAVKRIKEGRGDLEMIKDNNSIYSLLCENKERAIEGNYPWELAEQQNKVYKELCTVTAQLDINPEKLEASEILCKQAWTYLWTALDEFYQAGQIAFYHDPDIEELFYVDYFQRFGKKSVTEISEPEPQPQPEPETIG